MNDDGATAAGTEHATSSDGADTAAHTTRGTTSSAAQGVDGADTPNSNSGLRSVLATDFDVWQALGGVRGLVETGAPGLIFVAVYVVTGELIPSIVAPLIVSFVAIVARLVQRIDVMPAVGGPPMLLTRNLFYTAVTRARRMVMIVGRESAIDQMIANVNTRRRYSALCWRLQQVMSL